MRKIDKRQIEQNIKQLSFQYNKLSWKDLNNLYKTKELICRPGTIYNKFGNIKKILEKYNIRYYHPQQEYAYNVADKEKIIEILKQLPKDKEYNKKILQKMYKDNLLPFSTNKLRYIDKDIRKVFDICGLTYDTKRYLKLKGKTHIEILGKNKAEQRKIYMSQIRKGKSYEELYGIKKSNILKEQKRILREGKTFREIFGEEQSKNIVQKMNRTGWWILGRNEKKILDDIEKNIGIKIKRGFTVITQNGKINHIDGYIKENNLVIEIDEKYHNSFIRQQHDIERDKNIKEILNNCVIIRINEQKWLNNKIYRNEVNNILNRFIRLQFVECDI